MSVPRPPRLNRSQLVLPGNNRRFLEKAAQSDADVVMMDLEDAVPESEKETARATTIEALNDLDWQGRTVSVRVNGLDTPHMYQDLIAVLENAGGDVDLIMVPKVDQARHVHAVDLLIGQIEMARGLPVGRIGIEVMIESAAGVQAAVAIAAASPRLEALHFGPADYTASIGARTTAMGGVNPDYHVLTDPDDEGGREVHWGDVFHYPLSQMVVAARAADLRPLDGAFADFKDVAGYRAQAKRARALGCEGKWCIHPSQIEHANELFSPTSDEVAEAKSILDALAEAEQDGRAAVVVNGRMVDIASIRQARVVVAKADVIAGRG